LLGTTARLYWQLAYLNQSLELNEVDLESAEKTLAMAKLRYESGSVSELSVVQAEMNLLTQQNFRGQLLQQRVEARNALAILFNQPPQSEVVDPPKLQDGPLPAVAAGIPAEILANRPDLHAAELRLRAALVNIDVTRSSFYPTFSLTGFLGATSTSLQGLPQNSSASASLGLSLPFLQWNTAQLTIRVSKTQYEEALLNFRQRLYSALMEVENNLAGRLQLMDEEKKLTMLRAQAQRADSIARTRFEEGYTDIQPWLDAQASLRNAEHSVLLNRMNQMNNLVNLNKALGLGATSSQIVCSAKL
jgi:outer membrane protein TolC